jgi:hypothetical protein
MVLAIESKQGIARELDDSATWPAEVGLILSALEAGRPDGSDRRDHHAAGRAARVRYRTRAWLRLFADSENKAPWLLYTRDVNARSLGFVTPHRLPLGYGGVIELNGPDNRPQRVHCTLFRCRETVPGWFEGALYFNREQWSFDVEDRD